MLTAFNRHRPHFAIWVPVLCRVRKGRSAPRPELKGSAVEIGEEGLQVLLPRALRPGSLIEVELQTGWGPLLLKGEVVKGGLIFQDEEGVCHRIRFRRMTTDQQLVFETFFIGLIEASGLRGL